MKKLLLLLSITALISSCNSHQATTPVATDTTLQVQADTTKEVQGNFFAVTSFLKGQLIALDSVPFTPLLYTTVNNKTDSMWLKKDQLATYLAPFFSFNIDTTNLI